MKNLSAVILFVTVFIVASCGNNDKNNANDESNQTKDTVKTEESQTTSVKEFEGVSQLAQKTEFTVHELNRATAFLYSKEGILVGYPDAYEQDTVAKSTRMNDATDKNISKISVNIRFKNNADEKLIKTKQLFAVKGKFNIEYRISEKWGNELKISVYDAELLPDKNIKYDELTSLDDIDLSKIIFCGNLYDLLKTQYETLYNKEKISVTGIYNGTTTSKDSKGEIIETRVDLTDKDVGLSCVVGCKMEVIPDEKTLLDSQQNHKEITIEGKFGGCNDRGKIINGVLK